MEEPIAVVTLQHPCPITSALAAPVQASVKAQSDHTTLVLIYLILVYLSAVIILRDDTYSNAVKTAGGNKCQSHEPTVADAVRLLTFVFDLFVLRPFMLGVYIPFHSVVGVVAIMVRIGEFGSMAVCDKFVNAAFNATR